MENLSIGHTKNDEATAIFGTSSDAIVQGLANGDFLETDDDKNQIVNQQDQQEVVNPVETEFKDKTVTESSLVDLPTNLNNGSIQDEIQDEHAAIDGVEDEPEK